MDGKYAGIILAAGKAERFGAPKILVDWHGQPLLRHVTQKVMITGLSPVIVVLGAGNQATRQYLQDLPVEIVVNLEYEMGIGSSFSTGIRSCPSDVEGAFVFLSDHPEFPEELIPNMVKVGQTKDVVYPSFQGKPGHPVLWKRTTFTRINSLAPGETGRSIQKEFNCVEFACKHESVIQDIDTPKDYEQLRKASG